MQLSGGGVFSVFSETQAWRPLSPGVKGAAWAGLLVTLVGQMALANI